MSQYVHAAQFVNGQPIYGATKTSDRRQESNQKEDTTEARMTRLELYRVRLEAGLDIFSGKLKGEVVWKMYSHISRKLN